MTPKAPGAGGINGALESMDDPEVRALYGLPLGEFVAARNQLAKAKKKLAPDRAEEIKKLPKPTASAWIINQLVRREPRRVDHLLSAIDRVRAVQLAALSGGTELSLREVMKEEREAQEDLAEAASAALQAAGANVTRPAIDKALKAFHAAALDQDGRTQLEAGCLCLDFEEPGFDGLVTGDLSAAAAMVAREAPIDLDQERSRRGDEDSRRRAEEEARRRAEELRAIEERRRARKQKLSALQAQLEQSRTIEVKLLAELQGLERTAAEARRKAEEADRLAQTGRTKLEEAERKRQELEQRLAEVSAEPDEA